MHLQLSLLVLAAAAAQLATAQPLVLSPANQYKQSQLPPGEYLPPQRPSILRTKSQQQAALRGVAPVVSAVITRHTQEVVDVPIDDINQMQPQIVIVEPHLQPVTIEFRSRSSPVKVNTVHVPTEKTEVQATRSEEEPDRIIHEVVKPVIQEIREIIQPFRKITQQILPVQEEVHSIVTKGERRSEIEQVTDADQAAALAGAIPDQQQQQQQQEQDSDAALNSQERQRQEPQPAPQQQLVAIPQPQQQTFILQPQTIQLQPVPLEGQLTLQPVQIQEQPSNTVVQAGLIGGTRILPASEAVFEQQREVVSAIVSARKKRRSANIFRYNIPYGKQ